MKTPTAAAVLATARAQLARGPYERPPGSNRTYFGAHYGADGVAWCCISLWCVFDWTPGGRELLVKTGLVEVLRAWFDNHGRTGTTPRPGAVAFLNFGAAPVGKAHHVGLVEAVNANDTITTLEGNGLPLGMTVLTTSGWRPIGDLALGDEMVDPQGAPSVVEGVYPQGLRPCWEVTLSDGRTIVADSNHRWSVKTITGTRKVVTTVEMKAALHQRLSLPRIAVSPDLPGCDDLPLDPWVVGALLGDGGTSRGEPRFATTEEWVVTRFADLTGVQPRYTGGNTWTLPRMRPAVAAAGLAGRIHHEKVIPSAYLGGSAEHRLALLRGLMDTDGDCDKQGRASFTSASRVLSEQVLDLVRSLGGTAGLHVKTKTVYTYAPTGEKRTGRPAYRVQNVRLEDNPFTRPRKAARFRPMSQRKTVRGWSVVSVEPAPEQETVCIAVSAPSSLYIAQDWIVTHNTGGRAAAGERGDGYYRRTRSPASVVSYGYPAYAPAGRRARTPRPLPGAGDAVAARPAATIHGAVGLGDRGADVQVVQRAVGVADDGDFGQVTLVAVIAAQERAGVPGDGVVGPITAAAFGLVWAR